MNKILKNFLLSVLVGFNLLMLYGIYLETHQAEFSRELQLAALIGGPEKTLTLQKPTQFFECQTRGLLPDPECTPGSVFEDASKEEICVSGYSKKARNVSEKTRKKVFAMYGIDYPVTFGSYELDHLIPLSLGGSNEISNLWPKSAEPFPGFFEKNVTGNYLREEICAGRVALSIAQEQIAKNWFLIYQNIDPKKAEELKLKYPNWADRNK